MADEKPQQTPREIIEKLAAMTDEEFNRFMARHFHEQCNFSLQDIKLGKTPSGRRRTQRMADEQMTYDFSQPETQRLFQEEVQKRIDIFGMSRQQAEMLVAVLMAEAKEIGTVADTARTEDKRNQ